jgi:hypothetical protein
MKNIRIISSDLINLLFEICTSGCLIAAEKNIFNFDQLKTTITYYLKCVFRSLKSQKISKGIQIGLEFLFCFCLELLIKWEPK